VLVPAVHQRLDRIGEARVAGEPISSHTSRGGKAPAWEMCGSDFESDALDFSPEPRAARAELMDAFLVAKPETTSGREVPLGDLRDESLLRVSCRRTSRDHLSREAELPLWRDVAGAAPRAAPQEPRHERNPIGAASRALAVHPPLPNPSPARGEGLGGTGRVTCGSTSVDHRSREAELPLSRHAAGAA
jgi:hypothetical protein